MLPNIFVHKRINNLSFLKSCIYGSQEGSIVRFLGDVRYVWLSQQTKVEFEYEFTPEILGLCSCKIPCRKSKVDGLSSMACDWLLGF